jgi:hypothetical protein
VRSTSDEEKSGSSTNFEKVHTFNSRNSTIKHVILSILLRSSALSTSFSQTIVGSPYCSSNGYANLTASLLEITSQTMKWLNYRDLATYDHRMLK